MPQPDVIYMRADLSGQQPEMTAIINDAKSLLAFSPDVLAKAASALDAYAGFLSWPEFNRVVQECAPAKDQAKPLSGSLSRLLQLLQHSKTTVHQMLDRFASWKAEPGNAESHLLTDGDLEALRSRLPLVVKTYEAIVRQKKAERLSGVTGLRVETIDAICDLRPVFDDAHEDIVGVIPLTTLRLVYTGASGFPESVEVMLTEQQVGEMAEKLNTASKKLKVLRGWASENNKPVPVTPATKLAATPVAETGETK